MEEVHIIAGGEGGHGTQDLATESLSGWCWKGALEGIWSKPLLKQGHLEPVAWMAFEYLQGGALHSFSGQPVPVLSHSHGGKAFLMFRGNLLCFSLCPLPLVLPLGTTEKSLVPSFVHPPFSCLCTSMRSPQPSLLQVKQSRLSQPFLIGEMLQSLHHLRGILLDSRQCVHVSLVLGSPELDPVLQAWPQHC